MENMTRHLEPEILLKKVTEEALHAMALCGAAGIQDIEPLEASLPLIAKAWELPEEALKEQTDRMEQGKELAAANKSGLPGLDFYENYDGDIITELVRSLIETAARLDKQADRKVIYDTAFHLGEALDYPAFLTGAGKNYAKTMWGTFRNMVSKDDPQKREKVCGKALEWMDRLYTHGLDRQEWGMVGPA